MFFFVIIYYISVLILQFRKCKFYSFTLSLNNVARHTISIVLTCEGALYLTIAHSVWHSKYKNDKYPINSGASTTGRTKSKAISKSLLIDDLLGRHNFFLANDPESTYQFPIEYQWHNRDNVFELLKAIKIILSLFWGKNSNFSQRWVNWNKR